MRPAGLAIAGYKNCHVVPIPFSFQPVSHAHEPIRALIAGLFMNDVPHLARGSRLRMMIETAVARLIDSYLQLIVDSESNNQIVQKIQATCRKANIDDPAVLLGPGPRWHDVLKSWLQSITADFQEKIKTCLTQMPH